jgi:hypothetical protein
MAAGSAAAQTQPGAAPGGQQSSALHPQVRQGFWFNAGMGIGSIGCDGCGARTSGLSGGLSLGGTITERVLLGVGTTGFVKTVDGERLTAGTFDLRVRFYPVRTSGFFLTGGIGLGSVSYAGFTERGAGALVGLGWDIRLGTNTSLSVFYNGFAMSNSNVDANVGQLGIGVTFH